MNSEKFQIPVIVLSAFDEGGFTKDFFDFEHVNLLPFVHKTLFQYLMFDLLKKEPVCDKIKEVLIVTSEDQEKNYRKDIEKANIPSDKICYEYQRPLDEIGVLNIAEKVAEQHFNDNEPLMVLNGDTIVQDSFLESIINEAEKLYVNAPDESWIVLGLIRDKRTIQNDISKPADIINELIDLEHNRWGYYHYYDKEKKGLRPIDESSNLKRIDSSLDDIDAFNNPSYPELFIQEGIIPLVETGIVILSKKAREDLKASKSRDPQGYYSTINAIRRQLIENKLFKLIGVISESRSDWLDVNYPWEYLIACNYMANRLVKNVINDEYLKEIDDTEYRVYNNPEDLKAAFPYSLQTYTAIHKKEGTSIHSSTFNKSELKYSDKHDENYPIGVHENAIIEFPLIAPKKGTIYIGANTIIKGVCVLHNKCRINDTAQIISSIIGKAVLIDYGCIIDHTVVMENTRILSKSVLPYSIIGKNCSIGGFVKAACTRHDYSNGELEKTKTHGEYLSSAKRIRYLEPFSTVIGDNCSIKMDVLIQPGRKIGKNSKIYPSTNVIKNLSSGSVIKTKHHTEVI